MISKSRVAVMYFLLASYAAADYIDFKDGSERQYGFTVSISDQHIDLSQTDKQTGKLQRRRFVRDQIKSHVRTLDVHRLESLTPGKWHEYRNYAEELASLKNDPVARDTAIRLFALCVAHADTKIQKSAAKNLPLLASNEAQKRDFEVIEFLYGNGTVKQNRKAENNLTTERRKAVLYFVRQLRQERFEEAAESISDVELQRALTAMPSLDKERMHSAIAKRRISPDLRVKLLRLESKLISSDFNSVADNLSMSLAESFDQTPTTQTVRLSMEDIFPFDLRATQFRNGEWLRP